jgi:hypothetical protein
MTPAATIASLRNRGIVLELVGDQLRCVSRRGAVTPAIRDEILARRDGIVEILRSAPVAGPPASVSDSAGECDHPPIANATAPDALYGTGFILDVLREYRAMVGTAEGFITALEKVAGCDVLHERVTDEHLHALRVHLAHARTAKGPGGAP